MIHQKDGGQVGQTISHYAPKAHPPVADKILEKLSEGGMFQNGSRSRRSRESECRFESPPSFWRRREL